MAGGCVQRYVSAPVNTDESIEFTLELGQALHRYGAASPRVERMMQLVCEKFGIEAQLFAEPTSIVASFGRPPRQQTSLLRVEPGSPHLANRCAIDDVAHQVLSGTLSPALGTQALRAIEDSLRPLAAPWLLLAFTLASACSARFFGGGALEQVAAAGIGAGSGVLALVSRRFGMDRLFEPMAATLAAFGAMAWAAFLPVSSYTITVSGLVVLLPGLSFTTAVQELAHRHLASGTSRLMGSCLSFLGLGFGVALGRRAGEFLPAPTTTVAELPSSWSMVVALLLAPFSYAVLLRARHRDVPWILVGGIAAFLASRFGVETLGPEIGAFLGAMLIGAAANGWGRLMKRPALVVRLPGILMLVPGSVGFRSFAALLEHDVMGGIEAAFKMSLIAISLVSGLIAANVVLPPRQMDSVET